jgi:hypothetical protein
MTDTNLWAIVITDENETPTKIIRPFATKLDAKIYAHYNEHKWDHHKRWYPVEENG